MPVIPLLIAMIALFTGGFAIQRMNFTDTPITSTPISSTPALEPIETPIETLYTPVEKTVAEPVVSVPVKPAVPSEPKVIKKKKSSKSDSQYTAPQTIFITQPKSFTPPPKLEPLRVSPPPEKIKIEPMKLNPVETCRSWVDTSYGKRCTRTEINLFSNN